MVRRRKWKGAAPASAQEHFIAWRFAHHIKSARAAAAIIIAFDANVVAISTCGVRS
ncbi:hypothetical protein PSAC2689_10744 [Paraburkholderia sacchari]